MKEQTEHYEIALIISGAVAENEQPAILEKIKNLFKDNGAQLTQEIDLGRKKLAYAIKHLRHGFYFCLEFNLLPVALKNIEKELKLNSNVIRYLIIKKRVKTAAALAREEKIKAGRMKRELEKTAGPIVEAEKTSKYAKPKISLEDLDKKLNELLDENII